MFGSELCEMKKFTEYVRRLIYKLRMMWITCEGPTFVYGENKLVLENTSAPMSQLKKKSNITAYHFMCEVCVKDEWRTT